MRTISDFLGRKGAGSPVFPVAAVVQRGANGTEAHREATFADLGTRVGEDNEALRNLLLDTGRRLSALDDLKETFRNLVEPIGAALRSLEQEKTDNVSLRNALAELRTSHENVRTESHALDKRAAELDDDNAALRRQLALAQQTAKELENDKAQLGSELAAAHSEIAKLESRLAQEAANGQALGEANQILADHGNSADKRIGELQGECALTRGTAPAAGERQTFPADGARPYSRRSLALVASSYRERQRLDRGARTARTDGYQPGRGRE